MDKIQDIESRSDLRNLIAKAKEKIEAVEKKMDADAELAECDFAFLEREIKARFAALEKIEAELEKHAVVFYDRCNATYNEIAQTMRKLVERLNGIDEIPKIKYTGDLERLIGIATQINGMSDKQFDRLMNLCEVWRDK